MPCQASLTLTPTLDANGNFLWTWSIRQDQGQAITLLSITLQDCVSGLPTTPSPTWFTYQTEFVVPGGTPVGGADPGSLPVSATASFLHLHVVVSQIGMLNGCYCVEIQHRVGSGPVQSCLLPLDIGQFTPTFFIGDQNNTIWSFDVDDVVGSFASIITTQGSGVNPGRMGYDAASKRILFVDARGADVTLFVYAANPDGTGITKIGGAISTTTSFDQGDNCQISSNGRIIYQSTQRAGSMDLNGSNQVHCSELSGTRHDLAPSEFDNECYRTDGSADLFRLQFVTCSSVEMLDAVSVADVVTDRPNISESLVYWRTGKTIREVAHDASGDQEIWDGAEVTSLFLLIGINEGRIYFVYGLAGETLIGSVTKAGGDFTSHGRIDNLGFAFVAANCGTLSTAAN